MQWRRSNADSCVVLRETPTCGCDSYVVMYGPPPCGPFMGYFSEYGMVSYNTE